MRASCTLDLERELLCGAHTVIGIDEVGRGALAGPVAVGACAVGAEQLGVSIPEGLRDSKLLSPTARERIAPLAEQWVRASGVGWSSAAEIDEFGISNCLAAAAVRALGELWRAGVDVQTAVVLLDGSHDWLTPGLREPLRVVVRPKADRDCASVAAASVIAKVARDARMCQLAFETPGAGVYGWAANKGYGSPAHRAALVEHGPCSLHRKTWLGKILGTRNLGEA